MDDLTVFQILIVLLAVLLLRVIVALIGFNKFKEKELGTGNMPRHSGPGDYDSHLAFLECME